MQTGLPAVRSRAVDGQQPGMSKDERDYSRIDQLAMPGGMSTDGQQVGVSAGHRLVVEPQS